MIEKMNGVSCKLVDNEWAIYYDMAMTMLEEIIANNKAGKSTVMIVPVDSFTLSIGSAAVNVVCLIIGIIANGLNLLGASNDIQRATSLAKHMVTLYGMSDELGLMAPAAVQHQYLEGQAYLDCSQETAAIVDREVKKILNTCYDEAIQRLKDNRELLDEVALYLLAKETITGDELMAYINADKAEKEAADAEVTEE